MSWKMVTTPYRSRDLIDNQSFTRRNAARVFRVGFRLAAPNNSDNLGDDGWRDGLERLRSRCGRGKGRGEGGGYSQLLPMFCDWLWHCTVLGCVMSQTRNGLKRLKPSETPKSIRNFLKFIFHTNFYERLPPPPGFPLPNTLDRYG